MLFVFSKAPLNNEADGKFDRLIARIAQITPQDESQVRLVELQSTLHDLIEKHVASRDQMRFVDNLSLELSAVLIPEASHVVFDILEGQINKIKEMTEPVVPVAPAAIPARIAPVVAPPAAAPVVVNRAIDIEALKREVKLVLREKAAESIYFHAILESILKELDNSPNKMFLLSTEVYLKMNSEGSRPYNDADYKAFEAKALEIWEGIKRKTSDSIIWGRLHGAVMDGDFGARFKRERQLKQISEESALESLLPYVEPALREKFLEELRGIDLIVYIEKGKKILPI